MASVVLGDGRLTDLSLQGESSSLFGSARSHQSTASSFPGTPNLPERDYSETTFSEQTYPWQLGDDTSDPENSSNCLGAQPSLCMTKEFEFSVGNETNGLEIDIDDNFITPIRSHGAPLDTITERTSLSTIQAQIPASASSSFLVGPRHPNRKLSAPNRPTPRKILLHELRLTKSLDDKALEFQEHNAQIDMNSKSSKGALDNDLTRCTKAQNPAPRCKSPSPELSQWVRESSTSLPNQRSLANRKPSAYVRGVYRKLVGAEQQAQKSANTVLPSKIPVPTYVACDGRKERAYWKLPERTIVKRKLNDITNHPSHTVEKCGHASQVSDSTPRNASESADGTSEYPDEPKPACSSLETTCRVELVPKRSSSILSRTSRLFQSPRSQAAQDGGTPRKSKERSSPASLSKTDKRRDENTPDKIHTPTSKSFLLEAAHNVSPIPSRAASIAPSPLVVRNRSIFDIRADDPRIGPKLSHREAEVVTLTTTSLEVRNGLPNSLISENSRVDTPNSWELPLDPFPQPPSPNLFLTPSSSPNFQTDDNVMRRSTCTRAPENPETAPSLRSIDMKLEHPAIRSIAASDSSASLVVGNSLTQATPEAFTERDDPFISRKRTFDLDGVAVVSSSPSSSCKLRQTKQVYMPSPLRPWTKRNARYSLFPSEEQSTVTPKLAVKPSPIRNIRSLSSMLRLPSATMRASKSSDLVQTVLATRCPHGKAIERVNVFTASKLGGRAWRLRRWLRDGGTRCWRCEAKRLRTRLHSLGNRMVRTLDRKSSTSNGSMQVVALGSDETDAVPLPRVRGGEVQFVIKHPLEDIEKGRATREKKIMGSALIKRAMAFGDKWASWAPRNCFCQVVDDDESRSGAPLRAMPRERASTDETEYLEG